MDNHAMSRPAFKAHEIEFVPFDQFLCMFSFSKKPIHLFVDDFKISKNHFILRSFALWLALLLHDFPIERAMSVVILLLTKYCYQITIFSF